jgi:hypothetical protein
MSLPKSNGGYMNRRGRQNLYRLPTELTDNTKVTNDHETYSDKDAAFPNS